MTRLMRHSVQARQNGTVWWCGYEDDVFLQFIDIKSVYAFYPRWHAICNLKGVSEPG